MDNAIDELIAECGEILANPDSYNLVSEAKRIESALETDYRHYIKPGLAEREKAARQVGRALQIVEGGGADGGFNVTGRSAETL